MRRIYLVLLVAVLSFFTISKEVKGQDPCDVCQSPNLCHILNFDLPNCPGIRAVICYTCAVTHLQAYFNIYIENCCPGYETQAYDFARDWVLNNYAILCGQTPCNEEHALLTFVRPICGRVEVVNGRNYIYQAYGDCYRRCVEVWDWCWCNCVPGECYDRKCKDEPPYGPHITYEIVSYTIEGDGNCDALPYPSSQECTLIQWTRECGEKK